MTGDLTVQPLTVELTDEFYLHAEAGRVFKGSTTSTFARPNSALGSADRPELLSELTQTVEGFACQRRVEAGFYDVQTPEGPIKARRSLLRHPG